MCVYMCGMCVCVEEGGTASPQSVDVRVYVWYVWYVCVCGGGGTASPQSVDTIDQLWHVFLVKNIRHYWVEHLKTTKKKLKHFS